MRKNESIFTGRICEIRSVAGTDMYLLTVTGESVAGRYDLIIRPKPDGEVPKKGDIFEANVILKGGYITQVKDYRTYPCPDNSHEPNEKDIAENSPVFFDLRGTVVKNTYDPDSNNTPQKFGYFDVQFSLDVVDGIVIPEDEKDANVTHCYFPLLSYPALGTKIALHIIPDAVTHNDKQTLVHGTIRSVLYDLSNLEGLQQVLINVTSINGNNIENERYMMTMLLPESINLQEDYEFQFAFEVIEEPVAKKDTPVLQSKFPYTGWIGYTRDANITTIGDLTYNLVDVHVDQFNHLNVDQVYTFIVPTTDPVDLGDFIIFHVETLGSREIQTPTISGMITQITPMENLPELSVLTIRLDQIDGHDVVEATISLILPNNEDLSEGDHINFRVSSAKCIEEFKKHDADEDAPEHHDTEGDTAPLPTVKPKHGWRYWLGYLLSCRWLADLLK